ATKTRSDNDTEAKKEEDRAFRQQLLERIDADLDKEKKAGLALRQSIEDGKAHAQNLTNQINQLNKDLLSARKQEELKGYLQAPAPRSYIISEAVAPTSPAGLPWWAAGILAGILTLVGLWAVDVMKK
ncbi:MAG: hypothetical protein ACPHGZ_04440, partial [Schleiferiaceae bacterium]